MVTTDKELTVRSAGDNGQHESPDTARRGLLALVGALAVGTLAGCADGRGGSLSPEALATIDQAATGSTGVVWVDTIGTAASPGDLRGLSGSSSSAVAVARGFWSAWDGGGGIFAWDPSSAADDGGTVIPASGGGSWRRVHDGPLNVRWFGTGGTGSDDAAFTAALAAGDTVFVPDGTYSIAGTLVVGARQSLFGHGKAALLQRTGASQEPIVSVHGTHASVSGFKLENTASNSLKGVVRVGGDAPGVGNLLRVKLSDLWINGDGNVSSIGLALTCYSPDVNFFGSVHNLYIQNVGIGVEAIAGTNGWTFVDTTLADIGTCAWHLTGTVETQVVGGFTHQSPSISAVAKLEGAAQYNVFMGHVPEPGGTAVGCDFGDVTLGNAWFGPINCYGGILDAGKMNSFSFNGSARIPQLVLWGDPVLTISNGSITVSGSLHQVDTEGSAPTDDLDTINVPADGRILVLRSKANSRTPTARHGTGNLILAGGADFTFDSVYDQLMLIGNGGKWLEMSRSNNG